ncbi:hypothetical protein Droror1_Dr00021619 [Drosera rotundifolia]
MASPMKGYDVSNGVPGPGVSFGSSQCLVYSRKNSAETAVLEGLMMELQLVLCEGFGLGISEVVDVRLGVDVFCAIV